MSTIALGQFLRLYNDSGALVHAFQNFYINQTVDNGGTSYIFAPFGFSGMSTNRQGELSPATLVFPNTEMTRGYLDEALRGGPLGNDPANDDASYGRRPYVGEVDVCILNPDSHQVLSVLLTYTGQATSGGWDDTAMTMELSNVFDAVNGEIPTRTMQRSSVGSLPTSASIRLR
jgi:hypothetical protein